MTRADDEDAGAAGIEEWRDDFAPMTKTRRSRDRGVAP